MSTGKKYNESIKLIEKSKLYDASEAPALVCQTAKAKFDENVLTVGAEIYANLAAEALVM